MDGWAGDSSPRQSDWPRFEGRPFIGHRLVVDDNIDERDAEEKILHECCLLLVVNFWFDLLFFFCSVFNVCFYKSLSAKSNMDSSPMCVASNSTKAVFIVSFLIILVNCDLHNLIYSSGWTPETFLQLTSFFFPKRKILLYHLEIASPLDSHHPD